MKKHRTASCSTAEGNSLRVNVRPFGDIRLQAAATMQGLGALVAAREAKRMYRPWLCCGQITTTKGKLRCFASGARLNVTLLCA